VNSASLAVVRIVFHPVTWFVAASFAFALTYGLAHQAIWNTGGALWLGGAVKVAGIIILALLAAIGRADRLVVYALVFGAAGDWFLAQNGTTTFASGALAFAFGHFCYIRAFMREGAKFSAASKSPLRLIAILAVVAGAIAGVAWLIPVRSTWFIGLSLYTVVLTLMVLAALTLPASRWLAMAGAVLFLISDGFVAAELFYPQSDEPLIWYWRQFAGWMTYWAAQSALCLGMLNLHRVTPSAKAAPSSSA
jgi:uncharacterized membrane protein YhhN